MANLELQKEDYEITIKADTGNMPYWTCKRKGECCSVLSIEDYKVLYKMVDNIGKRLYNQIRLLEEHENCD